MTFTSLLSKIFDFFLIKDVFEDINMIIRNYKSNFYLFRLDWSAGQMGVILVKSLL